MPILNAIASVAVRDVAAASAWYERLLGRPADSRPMPVLAEWRFEHGGWLQVYEAPDRAGGSSVTLAVDDIEKQITSLRSFGIDPGRTTSSEISNVVMIEDPDGNSIAFAEAVDPTIAR